jgi:hypothetical protein
MAFSNSVTIAIRRDELKNMVFFYVGFPQLDIGWNILDMVAACSCMVFKCFANVMSLVILFYATVI